MARLAHELRLSQPARSDESIAHGLGVSLATVRKYFRQMDTPKAMVEL